MVAAASSAERTTQSEIRRTWTTFDEVERASVSGSADE
jgi:hypothetical protein